MHLHDPRFLAKVVARLAALADATRIRLLMRLRQRPANVTTLVQDVGVAQASVSKHLATLRQVGLVDVRRQGNQSIYFVRDKTVFDLCALVCSGVQCHQRQEAAAAGLTARRTRRRSVTFPRRTARKRV